MKKKNKKKTYNKKTTSFLSHNSRLIFQVQEREAFGKALASQGTILHGLAQSRLEVEQARLLTLKAAHLMDMVGNKQARQEIAMIKVVAPRMAQDVIDRAMQVSEASVVVATSG